MKVKLTQNLNIGKTTYKEVFEENGLSDFSDFQDFLDFVEQILVDKNRQLRTFNTELSKEIDKEIFRFKFPISTRLDGIRSLPVSNRLKNILIKNGIDTLSDMDGKSEAEMLRLEGLGRRSLRELRGYMRRDVSDENSK